MALCSGVSKPVVQTTESTGVVASNSNPIGNIFGGGTEVSGSLACASSGGSGSVFSGGPSCAD